MMQSARGLGAMGRVATLLAVGILSTGTARAADLPADRIRAEVAHLIPSPWTVAAVTIDPLPLAAPSGKTPAKDADSRGAARIEVRLTLAKPTYTVERREGPVTFVRPAAAAGLEKTLEATATGTRGANGWTVRVELVNPEVMSGIGQPADQLPGHTVVAGSEEARALTAQIAADAKARLAEEAARRQREEELVAQQDAAAKAEAERAERERRQVEARAAQITDLRAKLLGNDRAARVAAYEAALGGNDTPLRQFAIEAALQSRDPVLANLALKDWLARRKTVPVLLFATKEDSNSEVVLNNLGPLTLEIDSFNPVNGAIAGRMGAPGYSIAKPSAAIGSLAQTELTVNSFGCVLTLRLTEHQTMDGLFRCQTLPTLVARVTVD